jgi:ribose transport system substrate-binding protein
VTHRTFGSLLVLLALLAAGCGGSSSSGPADPNRKLRIAVIPKGTTHEFWKSVHHGADRAAKELGVEIIWKGAVNEKDRAEQINIVQDFVNQRVDGICLAPISEDALVLPVKRAKDRGIPTVIFDSGLKDTSDIVSYVATDNERGGMLGAQTLAKAMGDEGDVVLLRYNEGSESTHRREEGFLKELANHPKIKVLSSNQYSGTTRDSSLSACQTLMRSYGKEVDGVFAVAEPNNVGMLGALRGAQIAGKCKFVGFDPGPTLITALKDGEMHGIVLQDPDTMGYLAVKTLVRHLRGEQVDKVISTGEHVATPENMNDPKIQALLHPPQFGE